MSSPLPVLPLEVLEYQRSDLSTPTPLIRLGGWCGFFAAVTSELFLAARNYPSIADKTPISNIISNLIARFVLCLLGFSLIVISAIHYRQRLTIRLCIAVLLNVLAIGAIWADGQFWYKWHHPPRVLRWPGVWQSPNYPPGYTDL